MKFAFYHSVKNMKRKPLRSALLSALVLLIAFTVFSGAFVIISLQRGLEVYRARLGADIVVVPSSATGHGSVDDILLQGITGNYYMSGDICEKAAEILEAGNGVIIDHVITSERIFEQLKEALTAYPLRTVRVTCPPEILRRRELDRGDRCPGSAEASDRYLYPKEGYDLTVDTGTVPPADNAALILDRLF